VSRTEVFSLDKLVNCDFWSLMEEYDLDDFQNRLQPMVNLTIPKSKCYSIMAA
jgi:hypothetical protein